MVAATKNRIRQTARPLKDYREEAERALTECINASEPFTVDTVRMRMDDNVQDVHYNVLPSLVQVRQRRSEIVRIGSVRSPNRSRKSGWNALWIKAVES